jgi:hypothetical protein
MRSRRREPVAQGSSGETKGRPPSLVPTCTSSTRGMAMFEPGFQRCAGGEAFPMFADC